MFRKIMIAFVAIGVIASVGYLVGTRTYAFSTTMNYVYPTVGYNVNPVPGDFAPGYGGGSIASNGVAKTDYYFTSEMLFERDITLGEIDSISYWTKKGTLHTVNAADWYIAIYTKPYDGDYGTWYGDRLGSEPYFSQNLNAPIDTWNMWSTDGAENILRFFESTAGAPGANFGSYIDPTWDDFVSGNALSGMSYSTRELLYFSLQTGSAWASGFTGQIDGLKIVLTDGSVAEVNFEDQYPRSAEITSPLEASMVSGMVDFTAVLHDDDVDSIQWAVRQGTCAAGTNTVFGNVDGKSDVATLDTSDVENQTFTFTGDMSGMTPGMYCFIYNPVEDVGETNIRLTREFNLEETIVVPAFPTSKDMCKSDGWRNFTSVTFKNQGDCVSWVQSSVKAVGNRKDN